MAAPYSATTGQAEFDYRVTVLGVHGSTSAVRAALDINFDDLAAATGSVTVTVATLKTGNDTRDQHMAGALDSKRYSDAVFTLRQIEGLSKLLEGQQVSGTVTGQFSLKGVNKLLSAPVKLKRVGQFIEVTTQFKFNPYDYGVDYFGGAKSIAINVKFKLAGS